MAPRPLQGPPRGAAGPNAGPEVTWHPGLPDPSTHSPPSGWRDRQAWGIPEPSAHGLRHAASVPDTPACPSPVHSESQASLPLTVLPRRICAPPPRPAGRQAALWEPHAQEQPGRSTLPWLLSLPVCLLGLQAPGDPRTRGTCDELAHGSRRLTVLEQTGRGLEGRAGRFWPGASTCTGPQDTPERL